MSDPTQFLCLPPVPHLTFQRCSQMSLIHQKLLVIEVLHSSGRVTASYITKIGANFLLWLSPCRGACLTGPELHTLAHGLWWVPTWPHTSRLSQTGNAPSLMLSLPYGLLSVFQRSQMPHLHAMPLYPFNSMLVHLL